MLGPYVIAAPGKRLQTTTALATDARFSFHEISIPSYLRADAGMSLHCLLTNDLVARHWDLLMLIPSSNLIAVTSFNYMFLFTKVFVTLVRWYQDSPIAKFAPY